MRIKYSNIIFYLFLVLVFSSCKEDGKDDIVKPNIGYSYYPLNLGQEYIYEIDSIAYDDFTGTIDTFRFQRRYLTEEINSDLTGRDQYKIGVYERLADTLSWRKLRFESKIKNSRTIEYLSNNSVHIPFIFPVKKLETWDANALNSNEELKYTYRNVHNSSSVDNVSYDSLVTIAQRDEVNLIEQFFQEEKYAARIGLIYKKDKILKTELNGTIKSGYDLTIKLLEYNP